jgi:hypothetical protein
LLGRLWIEKKGKSQRPSLCAIESHSIIRSIFDFFLVVACGSLKHFLAHVHASSLELELEDWHESWSLLTLYRSLLKRRLCRACPFSAFCSAPGSCLYIDVYIYVFMYTCMYADYIKYSNAHIFILYTYIYLPWPFACTQRDLYSVKRDLYSVKRDLNSVKRDGMSVLTFGTSLYSVKRDLL